MDMEMNLSQEKANNREADAVGAECCLLAAASLVIGDLVKEDAEDKWETSSSKAKKVKSDIMISRPNNLAKLSVTRYIDNVVMLS